MTKRRRNKDTSEASDTDDNLGAKNPKTKQNEEIDIETDEMGGVADGSLLSCEDAIALITRIQSDLVNSKLSKQKKTLFESEFAKLSKYIQETNLELLKTKARKFDEICQSKVQASRSFASVVGSNTWSPAPGPQSHPQHMPNPRQAPSHTTIVVKSVSTTQLSSDTLLNLMSLQFKNSQRGIKVNRIRKAGMNVAVEVPTGQNIQEIIKAINEDVKEVSASLPKEKLPHILIKGIPKYTCDLRQSALIEDLCRLNNFDKEDFDLSFTPFVIHDNSQRATYDIVFRVKPKLYKKISDQNFRCWVQNVCCNVFKHVNILQCRHCLSFGHTKNHCPSKATHGKRCARCGEERGDSGTHSCCKTECFNCKNHVFYKNGTFDHAADRVACPLYKLRYDTCDRETNYFQTNNT